jgi:serine protein kinase
MKRLEEYGGDIRKFKVVKRYPMLKQVGVSKTEPGRREPGHPALVGRSISASSKPLRKTTPMPTASGGLCLANHSRLEFVENVQGADHRCCTRCSRPRRKATSRHRRLRRHSLDGIVLAQATKGGRLSVNNKNNEAFPHLHREGKRTACA